MSSCCSGSSPSIPHNAVQPSVVSAVDVEVDGEAGGRTGPTRPQGHRRHRRADPQRSRLFVAGPSKQKEGEAHPDRDASSFTLTVSSAFAAATARHQRRREEDGTYRRVFQRPGYGTHRCPTPIWHREGESPNDDSHASAL
jgi:hypothetical protein